MKAGDVEVSHMTKRRKKPRTVTRAKAVAKLERIIIHISKDVESALRFRATLEAANDIVIADPNKEYRGVQTYDAIHQSLVIALIMNVARLFDVDARRFHPNISDKASIPHLIRLLKQKRCQQVFADRARQWTPHLTDSADWHERSCRDAIEIAISVYRDFRRSTSKRNTLRRLKELRDREIAHSLTRDAKEKKPIYSELYYLLDTANAINESARFAITGTFIDKKDGERIYRDNADQFWNMALNQSEIEHDA